jgi:formate dehydrogenase subunit gamma
VHWTLAIVFLWLALTGLILLLGRTLLIPLFGHHVFSLLASASKESHNLFGPIFLVSLIMMLISFARRNIYEKGDLTWLLKGGGFIGKGHVSGGFFNMGEKSWYWMVILIGLAISISGLILVSPNFGQGRVIMAISHVVHVFGAVVLIAVSLGHMYMGSIGTEGSIEAMKSGYVDINWVEAHHDRWARQVKENGEVLSAEEFARLQGHSHDSPETTVGQN